MNYKAYPWGRWIKWGVIVLIAIILAANILSAYNSLVAAEQDVEAKWSQVENVMQSRLDAVNSMVKVAEGYLTHEQKIFEQIAEARSVLLSSTSDIESKTNADMKLTDAVRNIIALSEQNPQLKSDQTFHDLAITVDGSERRVSVERMRFIEAVNKYNKKLKTFPTNIYAKILGFQPKEYYRADPEALKSPDINFSE